MTPELLANKSVLYLFHGICLAMLLGGTYMLVHSGNWAICGGVWLLIIGNNMSNWLRNVEEDEER
jgi:hypothetical protein